jgi:hypothetical protein
MLYSEIIAVCSEIHTKHINTLCGQNVELWNVKRVGTYSNQWAVNFQWNKGRKLNVVSTVHFQMRCVQESRTNAHKLFNSLFLKYPYTYFGGLNHHLQGVVEFKMHRLIVITYMVTFIYVEYEWASIAHLVQYVKLL